MDRFNKEDMINHIASEVGLTRTNSEKALNAILSGITDTLKEKQEVTLIGFGTFFTAQRAERTGRNPRTGEALKIPPATQPSFRPGKQLKESVNV